MGLRMHAVLRAVLALSATARRPEMQQEAPL